MKRLYEDVVSDHFASDRQMLFLSGPRQVGKTTIARQSLSRALYLNWDRETDRELILAGQTAVLDRVGLALSDGIIFDELHKYPAWKTFLKGLFDSLPQRGVPILVTGSARLDVYRKGEDSLTGRYFHYRIHPLTVGELVHPALSTVSGCPKPNEISETDFQALLAFGGFPEPFLRRNVRFHQRWYNARRATLLREDLRDLTRVQELGQVETLATFLRLQSAGALNYAALATRLCAAQDSVRRWLAALESLYYCFRLTPWTENVARSLLKEPKVYLWDWSGITDIGKRNETFLAVHLQKAVQVWTDRGDGEFSLHYLRTKDGREVDFVVAKNNRPWMLVECKTSDTTLSPALKAFANSLKAEHAFQVVMDTPFKGADCFAVKVPVWVPAKTFLSQLP